MSSNLINTMNDFWTLNMRRIHGRKFAIFLLLLSFLFCGILLTHQSALLPPNALEYLDIMPTTYVKDIMARQLAAATKMKTTVAQSYEWESTYDDEKDNYTACALYQPKTRVNHGCTVDTDTKIPYCRLEHLKIDVTKIRSSWGGEHLDTVMNRDEDLEFPKYFPGAFSTPSMITLSPNEISRDYWYYLLDVFMSLEVNRKAAKNCDVTLPGISLLITRYEYVDLYHTLKDWWNTFMVLPDGQKADRVIFLDSHAQGHLDSVWKVLFGREIVYVQQLEGASTCLETAVFIPSGYSSVLNPLGRVFHGKRCTAMSKAFVDFVIGGYGLQDLRLKEKTILILDQAPHVTHPRGNISGLGYDNSRLLDMQSKLLDETDAISVQVVDLHKLSFRAQLKLVRQAHILLGYRGSCMSLGMFLHAGATFMEITDQTSELEDVIRWRPDVSYKRLEKTSHDLLNYEVVPNLKDVFNPGWDKKEGVKRFPPLFYTQYNFNDTEAENSWSDDPLYSPFEDESSRLSKVTYDDTVNYRECALNSPMPRPDHGCRVDPFTKIPYCQIRNLRVDVLLIDVSLGGEELDSVMGRDEQLEFPKYNSGALSTEKALDIPSDIDKSSFYYLNNVTEALLVNATGKTCATTVSTPTLFLTRYDYVDLLHTLADWWNTFFMLPDGIPKMDVIFLDGHAKGMLDPVWKEVFGMTSFVKQLPKGGVCFDHAIFIPSGYSAVLSPHKLGFEGNPCPAMTAAFVEFFIKAYGLETEKMEHGMVTILDAVPHVSHPRSDISKEKQTSTNLDYIMERILNETNATSVTVLRPNQMSFVELLRITRRTHLLMGHEGAGMAQLMFLSDGAHAVEFQYSKFVNTLAMWKPNITYESLAGVTGHEVSDEFVRHSIIPIVNYALTNIGKKALSEKESGDDAVKVNAEEASATI